MHLDEDEDDDDGDDLDLLVLAIRLLISSMDALVLAQFHVIKTIFFRAKAVHVR